MKHPAEDNVLKLRAIEKVVEQVSDIALHHLFCFVGDHEWTHIPAPVAVKEYVPWEYFLQFAARCGFADARRAADNDEVFHIAAPWLPRCRAKNRTELSISKDGTLKQLPGVACGDNLARWQADLTSRVPLDDVLVTFVAIARPLSQQPIKIR